MRATDLVQGLQVALLAALVAMVFSHSQGQIPQFRHFSCVTAVALIADIVECGVSGVFMPTEGVTRELTALTVPILWQKAK